MLQSSYQILRVAALLVLCLAIPDLALSQSTLLDSEKAEIVRAVLKSEQERQERAFESVTQLSTENIASLNPVRFAADFKLTLLTPYEIEEKAKDYIGAYYLAFKDFKIGGERAVVKLVVAKESTPCFGPYQKHQKEFTYRLERTGWGWKAELIGRPLANPVFGMKPNARINRAGSNIEDKIQANFRSG